VKKNVKQNVPGLAFINKLQPVTYNLDLDAADKIVQAPQRKDSTGRIIAKTAVELAAREAKEQVTYTGFIAQEVEKVAKSLNYKFSGIDVAKNDKDLYGLRYAEFVVPLVKAVQELSAKNDSLQKQINDLKAMVTATNQSSVNNHQLTVVSSALLAQNLPNPFSHSTTINYTIPSTYSSAKIVVTDKLGNTIKVISISGVKGSVTVDASTLLSGTYQYTLYVDGKAIDSKQMLLNK
jgi:hypothetical protein